MIKKWLTLSFQFSVFSFPTFGLFYRFLFAFQFFLCLCNWDCFKNFTWEICPRKFACRQPKLFKIDFFLLLCCLFVCVCDYSTINFYTLSLECVFSILLSLFPNILMRRICRTIKSFLILWSYPLFLIP